MSNKIDGVKPFGELSWKQKAKLYRAALDGKQIEYRFYNHKIWYINDSTPGWHSLACYRIKPEEAPELIPDSIDWSHIDDRFKFIFRDEGANPAVYASTKRPNPIHNVGLWQPSLGTEFVRIDNFLTSYKRGTVDWKDSLVERPE